MNRHSGDMRMLISRAAADRRSWIKSACVPDYARVFRPAGRVGARRWRIDSMSGRRRRYGSARFRGRRKRSRRRSRRGAGRGCRRCAGRRRCARRRRRVKSRIPRLVLRETQRISVLSQRPLVGTVRRHREQDALVTAAVVHRYLGTVRRPGRMQLPYGIILQFHQSLQTGAVRVDDADRTGTGYEQFRSVRRPGHFMPNASMPTATAGSLINRLQVGAVGRHDARRV